MSKKDFLWVYYGTGLVFGIAITIMQQKIEIESWLIEAIIYPVIAVGGAILLDRFVVND